MPNDPLPIVKLAGAIGVRSIDEAFRQVQRAAAAGPYRLDLTELTELDLTVLQLVESARLSAAGAGAPLRLTAPASGPTLEALRRAGFLADPPDERTRFWTEAAP